MDLTLQEIRKKKNNRIIVLLCVAVILALIIAEVVNYVANVQNQWVKFVEDCDCKCIKVGINPVSYPNITWDWNILKNGSDGT